MKFCFVPLGIFVILILKFVGPAKIGPANFKVSKEDFEILNQQINRTKIGKFNPFGAFSKHPVSGGKKKLKFGQDKKMNQLNEGFSQPTMVLTMLMEIHQSRNKNRKCLETIGHMLENIG